MSAVPDTPLFQPLYRQIAELITRSLDGGEWKPGEAIPSELELAARYKLGEQWQLDGSLAWTDARLTEDAPALGPSGSRLPNTARLAYSLGARYAFELRE